MSTRRLRALVASFLIGVRCYLYVDVRFFVWYVFRVMCGLVKIALRNYSDICFRRESIFIGVRCYLYVDVRFFCWWCVFRAMCGLVKIAFGNSSEICVRR